MNSAYSYNARSNHSLFNEQLNTFKRYFNPKLFYIDGYRNNIHIYYRYPNFNENDYKTDSECVKITIEKNEFNETKMILHNLKFLQPNICKISGVELLYLLYKVAKELKTNIIVDDDQSFKYFYVKPGSNLSCGFLLANYNILLNGESWYNKHGYYNESHEKELEYNENVRSMTISEYFDDKSITIDKILNYLNDKDETARLTFETPISDVMKVVDKILRKMEKNGPIFCDEPIVTIIQIIIAKSKIDYTNVDLELDIEDPDVATIYENLGKKLIFTKGGKRKTIKMRNKKRASRKLKKRNHRKSRRI